ncbi:hypothetical protein [Caulobacter sp. 17J65-9]|uniref:hypothetical protein n=1 Tax=Caulobacter sp. 17J65-9 TaxID=2709382 RepID=UPI0013C9B47E|nr:hypothetical protein [Caulobacter sp. 17J65-9]NEX93291.1 hypothetical protein [Caulobacter sp. 17J65-9]
MLLVLIYIFVQFAVVALTCTFGGRYERYAALVVLAGTTLGALGMKAFTGLLARDAASSIVNAGMFLSVLWIWWRCRAPWATALVVVEAVPVDLIRLFIHALAPEQRGVLRALWWGSSVLAYLQLGVLVFAVLRRELGPPIGLRSAPDHRPPASA